MDEKQTSAHKRVAIWIAVMAGSINGIVFGLLGYLIGWGPGAGMEGPFWKVLLTCGVSVILGGYVGDLASRKLYSRVISGNGSKLHMIVRSFAVVLISSILAFFISIVTGYLTGKLTGSISGLDWSDVFISLPVMALIFSIAIGIIAALIFGFYTWFFVNAKPNQD